MMAYVISLSGEPLDPTHPAKARKLVRKGKANVLQVNPFTIQLTYETTKYTQEITLGIDSGYQHIGFSAVNEKKEIISGELHLLQGMTKRMEERCSYRRTRRGRLRYRQPRFDNRKRNEGWLAPSIQHKLESHMAFIKK